MHGNTLYGKFDSGRVNNVFNQTILPKIVYATSKLWSKLQILSILINFLPKQVNPIHKHHIYDDNEIQ